MHMPRKGFRCRITPSLVGCLDNALRIASELSLVLPQRGLKPPYRAQKTPLRSVYAALPGNTSRVYDYIGLSSEDRVRADTSAVQDFWCPPP